MSFGFSVGDVLQAARLLGDIYSACFLNVGDPRRNYFTFGEQIGGLSQALQGLGDMLMEHNRRIQARGGGPIRGGAIDLSILATMIGDFQATIQRIAKLLDTASVFRGRRGYLRRIEWTLSTEQQVERLTRDCQFHMVKIQFAMKAIDMRMLMELSLQIDRTHEAVMGRLHRLEGALLDAIEGRPTGSTSNTNNAPTNQLGGGSASERLAGLIAHDRLVGKFEETLRLHPQYRHRSLQDIPLQEWTEAAAWWIDNGRCRFIRSREVPPEIYINLLKAAWLLRKAEETQAFQDLRPGSLWIEYVCTLSEEVVTEINYLSSPEMGLLLPDEHTLLRLPREYFWVWLSTPEQDTMMSVHDARPNEEKLLELQLEHGFDPNRYARVLRIFRQDEGTLRLVDSAEDLTTGSRTSEEFIVICAETQLMALYISCASSIGQTTPVYNVMMINKLQQRRDYSFKSLSELHRFQQAVLGTQVVFDLPNVGNVLCAVRPAVEGTDARIQIWLDKQLGKLSDDSEPETATPMLRLGSMSTVGNYSLSNSFRPGSVSASSGFHSLARRPTPTSTSTSSGSSTGGDRHPEVVELKLPKTPQMVIYFRQNKGWTFIQLPVDDNLEIKHERCCGGMTRILRRDHGGVCCLRTVLEAKKGSIEALQFPGGDWELDLLQTTNARKNAKKLSFKYVSLTFENDHDKINFNQSLEKIKLLRRKQRHRISEHMRTDIEAAKMVAQVQSRAPSIIELPAGVVPSWELPAAPVPGPASGGRRF